MSLNRVPVDELLKNTQQTAVHLEMRDGYMLNDPGYDAWKRGHRLNPDDRASWWRPWCDTVAETVNRGVTIRRARIVSEPVSDYIRYEYDVTLPNIAAGEQVRWLPRQNANMLNLPGNDFWLFDNRIVRWGYFSGNGDATGNQLTDNPEAVKHCQAAFDAVWQLATPHDQYKI